MDLPGELSFPAPVLIGLVIRNLCQAELLDLLAILMASRREEPETVIDDAPAERSLVRFIQLVEWIHLRRVVRLFRPARVADRVSNRAGEIVASRLGDRRYDTAGKATEFRRDTAGQDRRLTDRVLDE